jgi:hypothetical protein
MTQTQPAGKRLGVKDFISLLHFLPKTFYQPTAILSAQAAQMTQPRPADKISGVKDFISLLHLLPKTFYQPTAIL